MVWHIREPIDSVRCPCCVEGLFRQFHTGEILAAALPGAFPNGSQGHGAVNEAFGGTLAEFVPHFVQASTTEMMIEEIYDLERIQPVVVADLEVIRRKI